MKKFFSIITIFIILFFSNQVIYPQTVPITIKTIMKGIEKRYSVSDFSADFNQIATIKAMDIQDFASGKIYIKPPKQIRWEYNKPDQQIFISNGHQLWIYKPNDNQVMIGNSSDFFGDGNKGASFLSDIRLIRKNFNVSIEKKLSNDKYMLKLVPYNKSMDISVVYLTVLIKTFHIIEITSINSYKDETVIKLSNIKFKQNLNNSIFNFKIPENTEILLLDKQ